MLARMRSFLVVIAVIHAASSSPFLLAEDFLSGLGDVPPIPPDLAMVPGPEDLPPPATMDTLQEKQMVISNNQTEILDRLKSFDNQAKVRQDKISAFIASRTSQDRWSTYRALTTPLPRVEAFRHEITNQPIHPNNSLPAAHDPNDHLNPVAHGTSSLQSYRLTPFFSSTTALTRASASSGSSNPFAPFGSGAAAGAATDPTADLTDNSPTTLDVGFQIRPGMFYDTGFVAGSDKKDYVFNPGHIALNGSPESNQNGQVYYNVGDQTNGSSGLIFPYRPQLGITSASDIGTGRAYTDLISSNDGTSVTPRTAVLQYVDPNEEWVVIFGQTETLFGDLGSSAASLITGALPVGTVSTSTFSTDPVAKQSAGWVGVPQARLGHYWHNTLNDNDLIELAFSAEDPRVIDSTLRNQPKKEDDVTILQRYPTFVGRTRYQGSNLFDSYQVAALVRPMDIHDNINGQNASAIGYGISTNARFELIENGLLDTFYVGGVAGRGIGGYIFGDIPGAVAQVQTGPAGQPGSTDSLRMLSNVGGYGAYRHVWTVRENGSYWSSNFMGGLAQSQDPGNFAGADGANRNLYQAGCNLLWHSGKNSTIGLEYQYGSRLASVYNTATSAVSTVHGEDHRIMLVMQFGLNPSIKQGAPNSASKNANALRSFTAQDAASASSSSRISRMRF